VQDIEQLTLVLVNALHLYVEHHVGRDTQLGLLFQVGGEALLVCSLHVTPVRLEVRVVRVFADSLEFLQIGLPLISDFFADQGSEFRIAGGQPAALRDAVGLVVESLGPEFGKITEETFT